MADLGGAMITRIAELARRLLRHRLAVLFLVVGLVVGSLEMPGGLRWLLATVSVVLVGLVAWIDSYDRSRQKKRAVEVLEGTFAGRDDASSASFVSRSDGRLVVVNRAYLDLFGFASLGKARRFRASGLWVSRGDRRRWVSQLRHRGSVIGYETELKDLYGHRFPVLINARIDAETSEIHGTIETVGDSEVGERVVSRDRYVALFEASPTPTQIQNYRPMYAAIDELAAGGVENLSGYLAANPGEALRLSGLREVAASNPAMIELLGGESVVAVNRTLAGRSTLVMTPEAAVESVMAAVSNPTAGSATLRYLLHGHPAVFQLGWSAPEVEGSADFSRVVVTFTDVTELEVARERFQTLFESSPVPTQLTDYRPMLAEIEAIETAGSTDVAAYFVANPDEALRIGQQAVVVAANPAMAAMLGVSETGSVEGPVADRPGLVFPAEAVAESLVEVVRSPRGGTIQMHGVLAGRPVALQYRWSVPVVAGSADFSRVVTSYSDVSEIERERERFQALFEASPVATQIADYRPMIAEIETSGGVGIGDIDKIGAFLAEHREVAARAREKIVVLMSNPAMARLVGAEDISSTVGLVADRPGLEVSDESVPPVVAAVLASPRSGSANVACLLRGRPAVLLYGWSMPMVGGAPDFSRVVATFVDVTPIEAEKQRFEALFESSPVPMRLLDMSMAAAWVNGLLDSGVTDLEAHFHQNPDQLVEGLARIQVTAANQAAARLYGMSPSEMLRSVSEQPSLAHDQAVAVGGFIAFANGAQEFSADGDVVTAGGTVRHVRLQMVAPRIGSQVDYSRVIAATADMTDVETARREAERLSTLKTQLIASVSHELRTPLTAVVGYSDLLETGRKHLPDGDVEEMVTAIAASGRQMSGIVEDLLTSARSDLGQLAIAPALIDLHVEIEATLPTIDMAGRTVTISGDSAVAWADSGRVRQIIRNLVTNAVRHGQPPIEISTCVTERGVCLRVSDRGPGVGEEAAARLFELYWVGNRASGHTESVGLGLHLCLTLARRMDGDLAYSRQGDITVFELTLPTSEQAQKRVSA